MFVFHSWLNRIPSGVFFFLPHVLFTASSAAGWKRFGAGGVSPPRAALCCASRSLASPGSHGSAEKQQEGLSLPTRHHGVRSDFLSRKSFIYLVESSWQEDADLLHPVGGGHRLAAGEQELHSTLKLTFLSWSECFVSDDENLPDFIRPLGVLIWSPMGATVIQAFFDHPFTSSLHYRGRKEEVSLKTTRIEWICLAELKQGTETAL